MKTGFVFDLDGTLVDSIPGIARGLNLALKSLGYPEHSVNAIRGMNRCSKEETVLLYWVTAWFRLLPREEKWPVRMEQVLNRSAPASEIFLALSASCSCFQP